MITLTLETEGQRTELTLAPGTHTLGRAKDCAIVVANDTVARRHAEITIGPDGVHIRDLASTAGVFVNGELVRTAPLRPGDRFSLGTAHFTVGGAR